MAKVDIDNSLLRELGKDAKRRGIDPSFKNRIEGLIERSLQESARGRYAFCDLTGCRTQHAFRRDLDKDTWGSSLRGASMYEEEFLCIDIDDFKVFNDEHGEGRGDGVLAKIGSSLRSEYGDHYVYRYGGDDFVVRLADRHPFLPEIGDLELNWSLVSVEVQRSQLQNKHLTRWIEQHIVGALLSGHPDGGQIEVHTPEWLITGA